MKTPLLVSRPVVVLALAGALAPVSGSALAQTGPYYVPYQPAPVALYPAAPAMPGWAAGATVGSLLGATVSASRPLFSCAGFRCAGGYGAAPILAGALIGGIIGHVASTPPLAPVGVVYASWPAPRFSDSSRFATVPATRDASAARFAEHWQQFASPPAGGSTAGSAFAERWQSFAEPYASSR